MKEKSAIVAALKYFFRRPRVFSKALIFFSIPFLLTPVFFVKAQDRIQEFPANRVDDQKVHKFSEWARNADLVGCPTTPISIGQTINGSLVTGDCTDPDTGAVADAYLFSGGQGQVISSAFASQQFDTLLFVFDLAGNLIGFNDNVDSGTSNSRVPSTGGITLPSTQFYILFATSTLPSGRGNYSINLWGGTQAGCDFTLSPTFQTFQANGGTGNFSVTPNNAACAWQPQSTVPWITTSSSGTGNGTANYSVAINDTSQGRQAALIIGARMVTIQQNSLSCSYSRSPIDIQVPAIGGQFSFNLDASNSLCPTNITSPDSWITIQNPDGNGSRQINYTVAPNHVPVARNGSFFVGNREFGILQWWRRAAFSFDTGGQANLSLYRPNGGLWIYKFNSPGGEPSNIDSIFPWGLATDKPVPADYDGDARSDYAVFRDGNWYIIETRNFTFRAVQFGQTGDLPRPADFDGDEKADINVYRPSSGDWFRLNSINGQFFGVRFGTSEDKPQIADFNADGKSDITVYRPSIGTWYWLDSATGGFNALNFGISTDIPVPADYDGDSKTDIAVYRPGEGNWYRFNSSNGQFVAVNWGASGDIPSPAEFDRDGKADVTVFRPSNGTWYRLKSSTNTFDVWTFGAAGDVPLPSAYQ